MTFTRALIATAILALAATAAAQHSVDVFAGLLANEIDAIVIDCPAWAVENTNVDFPDLPACVRAPFSVELTRMQLERFVRVFEDLRWHTAWQEYDSGNLARAVTLERPYQAWAVFIYADWYDRWNQLLVIQEFAR